jgi:hypothetical protein
LRKLDGSCRTLSTDESDQTSLIHLLFGVNSIYTCVGTSLLEIYNNIKGSINMVGSFGSTNLNLNDFVKVIYPTVAPSSNDNLQLIFYYISLGTQASPQYQILKA